MSKKKKKKSSHQNDTEKLLLMTAITNLIHAVVELIISFNN